MKAVSLAEILPNALKNRYAVPSFNVFTLDMIDAVLKAANSLHSPVIVGLAERHIGKVNPWLIAGAVQKGVEQLDVPVVFHLDHSNSLKAVELGFKLGCTSVMIDGSRLPFEENVRLTREAVNLAHSRKVSVEGELGTIAGIEGEIQGRDDRSQYTDPAQAAEFARQTGVDALAVAIGTVHGVYRSAPRLRFDILEEIARQTDVPLVLHGGTGLSKSDFSSLIDRGITKINVFTELSIRNAEQIRRNLAQNAGTVGIAELLEGVSAELTAVATDFIRSFRCGTTY